MAMRIYVSSEEAAFFNNNKMGYADSIPTSGSYKVGDFIISSTQLDGIFGWVCTEEGTPGKWEVIGSGAGGGKLVSINASKVIDTAVNQISLTELGLAVDSKDKLMVHFNSMFLMEGVDYQISADGSMITKLGEGNWNESNIAGCLFTFELLKNVENVDAEEIKVDSKLICEKNNVTVASAVREVNIGISGFNKSKDTLIVYKNATYLIEGVDYEVDVNSSKIVSLNGVWNESAESDYIFTFVVFKEVATITPEAVVDTTNIVNGSVTMDKLSNDVKQAIENASNIDLSGYAKKTDVGDKTQLQTNAKNSLVDAVNELFQNANNGKELIATAIGEPLNSSDTFSAMSGKINNLLSTFKVNMMNNGISVEADDKFKRLIDKLVTMIEGGNKGFRVIEGSVDANTHNVSRKPTMITGVQYSYNESHYKIPKMDFEPLFLYAEYFDSHNNWLSISIYFKIPFHNQYYYLPYSVDYYNNAFDNSIHNNTVMLLELESDEDYYYMMSAQGVVNVEADSVIKYYAIGVGEEDTTLLDSLKSILIDESVEVTDEDTMAELIVKTDNEFTNKNNQLNSKNNELNNNKQALVDALNNKGIEASVDNTYEELIENINEMVLSVFPNWFRMNGDWIYGAEITDYYGNYGTATVNDIIHCINDTMHLCYNIKDNTYTTKSNLPTARGSYTLTEAISNNIYCIGGVGKDQTNECYDTITDTWASKAKCPKDLRLTAGGVIDNKIYQSGGNTGENYGQINYCYCYDPNTDTWSSKANMPANRAGSGSGVANNLLYQFGGVYHGWADVTSSIYCYDPNTDTWNTKSNMSYSPRSPYVASVNNKLYYMGGCNSNGGTYYNYNYCYDPINDTSTKMIDIPGTLGMMGYKLPTVQNYVCIIGGSTKNVLNSSYGLLTNKIYITPEQ